MAQNLTLNYSSEKGLRRVGLGESFKSEFRELDDVATQGLQKKKDFFG